MKEKHLYEYAVIRIMPVIEREEFQNMGIILFCKKAEFIEVHYTVNEEKLHSFSPELDISQIEMNMQSFVKIAKGMDEGGPLALLDIASRFRWLTAFRSSAIQTSRPHPGLCVDLVETAKRLFEEIVL